MNLLFVLSHLRKGGLVEIVYNLCRQLLKEREITLYILTLRKESEQTKIDAFRKLGILVEQLNLSYGECEILTKIIRKKVQQIVESHHIDIVHCHGYHSVLVGSRLKGVWKLSTLHDRANEDFLNVFGPFIGNYMLRRYLHSLQLFDRNIAVGKSAAEMYQKYMTNVVYVNNGIDISKYSIAKETERISLRKRLGLPLDAKIFISTGRIEREKRYEELTAWFLSVAGKFPAILLVLGDGSRLKACRQKADNSFQIIFTGNVSNVADYLKCSDYYISNSKSEGMSLAVCEGICCGLFPVLSDIPAHRDVAEDIDGIFFVHPSEINIEALLEKTTNKEKLHQYIVDRFSNATMVASYLEYYNKCGIEDKR